MLLGEILLFEIQQFLLEERAFSFIHMLYLMDVPHLSHLNFLKGHLCLPLLFDFSIRKIIKSLIESLNLPHKLFFERIYCILIVISLLFQLNLSG